MCREAFFEVNGVPRVVEVVDKKAGATGKVAREQVDKTSLGSVGAPMSGEVVEISVKPGARLLPTLVNSIPVLLTCLLPLGRRYSELQSHALSAHAQCCLTSKPAWPPPLHHHTHGDWRCNPYSRHTSALHGLFVPLSLPLTQFLYSHEGPPAQLSLMLT